MMTAIVGLAALAVGESRSLIVVCPRSLVPAVHEFAAFKKQQLPTELVELERILGETPGADDPEKLKRFLFGRWTSGRGGTGPALGFVLLIGDADIMPVRYMVLDRNTEAAFNYAFYPSDLYYADLAKQDGTFEDWNGAKGDPGKPDESFHAAYFGEVRGEHFKTDPMNYDRIDYTPEIGVGRWPVSTPEQAAVVAAKTMAYQQSLSHLTQRRVALVASGGWIENRPAMESMAGTLGGDWSVQRLFWRRQEGAVPLAPPDESHVVECLNSGVQLILHSGHGSDTGWHGAISTRSIPSMHNEAAPAILMSAGCSTARLAALPPYEPYRDVHGREHAGTDHGESFTAPPPPPSPYQTGAFNTTGLGEELLRAAPAGAAAYIGCNTGSQPCGMTLMAAFVDSISLRSAQADPVLLGDCWKDAVAAYIEREHLMSLRPTADWYPASIFFQGMKFMLYGDPSLPMPIPRRS